MDRNLTVALLRNARSAAVLSGAVGGEEQTEEDSERGGGAWHFVGAWTKDANFKKRVVDGWRGIFLPQAWSVLG